jgi:hypothetical protein
MIGVSIGATVPHLNMSDIRSMELPPLPPVEVQRKIAAILSAYDDLIENNNRRIKLLEEMAKRIYREWFVDFRYPGHEAVPLVESELGPLPKGWVAAPLFEVAEVTFGYPFKSELFNGDYGLPVIRIRDIPNGESGTLTLEEPSGVYRVSDGTFSLAWMGTSTWGVGRQVTHGLTSGLLVSGSFQRRFVGTHSSWHWRNRLVIGTKPLSEPPLRISGRATWSWSTFQFPR